VNMVMRQKAYKSLAVFRDSARNREDASDSGRLEERRTSPKLRTISRLRREYGSTELAEVRLRSDKG